MNSVFKQVKGAALTLALVAAAAASHAAPVGQPVTIQESAISGALANSLQVDQLIGAYDEVVTFLDATKFSTVAIFKASGWNINGSPVPSQLNLSPIFGNSGYGLYAKFKATGTYSTVGTVTTFSGGSGGIEIWADSAQDTLGTVGASASAIPAYSDLVITGATEDKLLASATAFSLNQGSIDSGSAANGNFEIVYNNFSLQNPDGENYFTAPRPFYMLLDLNGNFQSISPVVGASVKLLNNSANGFFLNVPEPDALALVALAMLGMGVATRRGRKM